MTPAVGSCKERALSDYSVTGCHEPNTGVRRLVTATKVTERGVAVSAFGHVMQRRRSPVRTIRERRWTQQGLRMKANAFVAQFPRCPAASASRPRLTARSSGQADARVLNGCWSAKGSS